MTPEIQQEHACAPQREDARDLIARLCRELGIAAVAAELKKPEGEEPPLATLFDIAA